MEELHLLLLKVVKSYFKVFFLMFCLIPPLKIYHSPWGIGFSFFFDIDKIKKDETSESENQKKSIFSVNVYLADCQFFFPQEHFLLIQQKLVSKCKDKPSMPVLRRLSIGAWSMLWNVYMQRKESGHYIQGKGQNVTTVYLHVINLKQSYIKDTRKFLTC